MVQLCALGEAADSLHFDWWWREIPLQMCRLINQDSHHVYDLQKTNVHKTIVKEYLVYIVGIQNMGLFIQN